HVTGVQTCALPISAQVSGLCGPSGRRDQEAQAPGGHTAAGRFRLSVCAGSLQRAEAEADQCQTGEYRPRHTHPRDDTSGNFPAAHLPEEISGSPQALRVTPEAVMGKESAVNDRAQDDRIRTLQDGLEQMGLALSVGQQASLLQYLDLLVKWNKAFNLSGVKDPGSMLPRHLLDSLTLIPWMNGQHILDVGTGPGLPGIPLAIAFPDKHFSLLDSNGKKTRFVFQAHLELELTNVTVH